MTVFNLGSINADHFYEVPHLPRPGETLAATGFFTGLGGKGANQSVAAAHAGSRVVHLGAVGADGGWAIKKLHDWGVDTSSVQRLDIPTGHAIINVDSRGENSIVIFPGANREIGLERVQHALAELQAGDILMLQNETSLQSETAKIGRQNHVKVIYSAAPFCMKAVRSVLPYVSILMMNKIEYQQFLAEIETDKRDFQLEGIVITRGADGADWLDHVTGKKQHIPALPVHPVDTTGAGDTFAGYFAAGLEQGMDILASMRLASAAAALKTTRHGTARAIPWRDEVEKFAAQ